MQIPRPTIILMVMLSGMLVTFANVVSQDATSTSPTRPRVEDLMGVKLVHAKELLESLALEDFERIEKNAQQLELLSRDSGWKVLQTQAYRQLSDEFRRASRMMVESAQNQNLDGASLGYVQLTLACIECHKHVRHQARLRGSQ